MRDDPCSAGAHSLSGGLRKIIVNSGVVASAAQRATGGHIPEQSSGPLFRPSTHSIHAVSTGSNND